VIEGHQDTSSGEISMSTMCEQDSFHITHPHHLRALVALGAVIAASGACSSSHSSPTAPAGSASLAIAINGPAGITPDVVVTVPNGYRDTVHTATTLTALAAGTYAVAGVAVIAPDSIVGALDTAAVSGTPATLATSGSATVTVTYTARPGSGGLWVANVMSPGLVRYAAGQLGQTTSLAPGIKLSTGQDEWAIAFDAAGNLWVAQADENTVSEYAVGQLGASGSPTAVDTITATAGSLNGPGGLAFDQHGNLWVANSNDSTVVEFTPSQLAAGGSPTPAVIISGAGGNFSRPEGLAFDAGGDLWVASTNDSSVVEFTPSQLASGGPLAPTVVIGSSSGSLNDPYGVAFDQNGNLWVAVLFGNTVGTVVEYSKALLAASGTPRPTVTLSASAGSFNGPVGLAFDASNDLWVANEGGSLVEFAASQLASAGPATPSVVVTGSGIDEPFALAFDPHPAQVPLRP
jgi:sugar lactone lactonase YvrE